MEKTRYGGALQGAIQNIERFFGYKLVSILPSGRLRWLGGRATLKDVLERLSVNCVLDVGANQGQYGLGLRRIGYKGSIFSFEPIQANLEKLESVAKNNGPWRTFRYALGAANGKLPINVTEDTVFSSFLTPREDSQERFPQNRVERTEEVEIRRLDDILESCLSGIQSPRLYLKLDTQGFDLEVVKGAESALANVLALQTEISFKSIYAGMPGFLESIQEFQARGFEVVDFWPVNFEADDLFAIEMDCVMARR